MVLPTPQAREKAEQAARRMDAERWETPDWLQIELDAEIRRLMAGGYLKEIYRQTPDNSERGWLIAELSHPYFQRVLDAKWIEYPITAHNDGVSFSVRVGKNQAQLYQSPFADRFVPVRLFFDVTEKTTPNGAGIRQAPPPPPKATPDERPKIRRRPTGR